MDPFNLIERPWIPCRMIEDETSGDSNAAYGDESEPFGLKDTLLKAHQIREIVGDSPLVTIGLYRLLLAILHDCFRGPRDVRHWQKLRDDKSCYLAEITKYFSQEDRCGRFNLFDDKYPFYQTPGLQIETKSGDKKGKGISAARLFFQADNNPLLFDHTMTQRPPVLTPAQAARFLVAFQSFDSGGLITPYQTITSPKKEKGKKDETKSADAAPLIQAAVCLVRGRNLFETLMLNLHHYNGDVDEQPYMFDEKKDLPAWERSGAKPESRSPDGPVDVLTWQSRCILLRRENQSESVSQAIIMKGYVLNVKKDADRPSKEPMVAFRENKKPKKDEAIWPAIGFQEERVLWRDSLAFLQSIAETRRPKMMGWLGTLVDSEALSRSQIIPMEFFGLSASRASLKFWRHERLLLPLAYLAEDSKPLLDELRSALKLAERGHLLLQHGLKTLALFLLEPEQDKLDLLWLKPKQKLDKEEKKRLEKIEKLAARFVVGRHYWPRLEARFRKLIVGLPEDQKTEIESWAKSVQQAARDAFREVTRTLSPSSLRNLKAVSVSGRVFEEEMQRCFDTPSNHSQKQA